jgi:hypothetical protein
MRYIISVTHLGDKLAWRVVLTNDRGNSSNET